MGERQSVGKKKRERQKYIKRGGKRRKRHREEDKSRYRERKIKEKIGDVCILLSMIIRRSSVNNDD